MQLKTYKSGLPIIVPLLALTLNSDISKDKAYLFRIRAIEKEFCYAMKGEIDSLGDLLYDRPPRKSYLIIWGDFLREWKMNNSSNFLRKTKHHVDEATKDLKEGKYIGALASSELLQEYAESPDDDFYHGFTPLLPDSREKAIRTAKRIANEAHQLAAEHGIKQAKASLKEGDLEIAAYWLDEVREHYESMGLNPPKVYRRLNKKLEKMDEAAEEINNSDS